MNQEEIEQYIRKKLRSGYPAGELENELLQKGIPEHQIKAVMNKPKNTWTQTSTARNIIIMNTACILLLIVAKTLLSLDAKLVACLVVVAVIVLPYVSFRMAQKKS